MLDLTELVELFEPVQGETYRYDFEENFLTRRIYIREEMETAFKELLSKGNRIFLFR